jgi:hypothetical protein
MSDEEQHSPPQTQDEVKTEAQETVNIKVRFSPIERAFPAETDDMA